MSMSVDRPLTVLLVPLSEAGPTYNSVGIGDALRQAGHRVVFAVERTWQGRLSALGFEEQVLDVEAVPDTAVDPGQFWVDAVALRAPEYRKPTIARLGTVLSWAFGALGAGVQHADQRVREIIADCRPDVIVQDNFIDWPALRTAGVPWVRIVSCNPLEVKGPGVPPALSGFPSDDAGSWSRFRTEYDRALRPVWEAFDAWVTSTGASPLDDLEFINQADLNLYLFPEELDYLDDRPLPATWHRLDSSVRETDTAVELPAHVREGEGSLIYLSLGTLGSADVDLMRSLIAILADTPHRYVVSLGPRLSADELAPNMWGTGLLPQPRILPEVDLVITHGGNNTMTETMHFGKPMIVLPLFWDQYDNAQRIQERGFGLRLEPYRLTPDELREAIESLLADTALRQRCDEAGRRIRSTDGVHRAARLIEEHVASRGPRQTANSGEPASADR